MKWTIFFIVCLVLSACDKGNSQNQIEFSEKSFIAYAASYTGSGHEGKVDAPWNPDDKFSVFGTSSPERHQKFKLVETDGVSARIQGRIIESECYYAVHPHLEGNSLSSDGLSFVISSCQTPVASTFDRGAGPAIAISEDNQFHFMNTAAMIRFSLPDNLPGPMVKAVLKGNEDEKVSGTFSAVPEKGRIASFHVKQGLDEVALDGRMEAGASYCFLVAPNDFSAGISIACESEGGDRFLYSSTKPLSVESGRISDLGKIQLSAEGDAYPGTTGIGRKLSRAEGIMGKFISDQSYSVTEGLVETEVTFLNQEGQDTRTFFFEIDLNDPDITLSQTTPNARPLGDALQTVTRQALIAEEKIEGLKIWGGTNSDFFDMKNGTNLPHGIFHHEGTQYKDFFNPKIKRKMSFFYLTKDKVAGIGLAKDYNSVVSTGKILEAFGGGELLVDEGKVLDNPQPLEPRTCIGISEDGRKVYVMVVDGRRPGYSNGMTLNELALCMQAIGADKAINLDGGGSSTFFVRNPEYEGKESRFEVRNLPSDNAERPVASGLVIVQARP